MKDELILTYDEQGNIKQRVNEKVKNKYKAEWLDSGEEE